MTSKLTLDNGVMRTPRNVKVALRLKKKGDETKRLRYKVKDHNTVVIDTYPDPNQGSNSAKNRDFLLFKFDNIFDVQADDKTVTDTLSKGVINELLDGYNVSIMMYGQSNTGKSSVLYGSSSKDGLIQEVFNDLGKKTQDLTAEGSEFTFGASFIEINAENIYDLLSDFKSSKSLKISHSSKGSATVKELRRVHVETIDELSYYLSLAKGNLDKRAKRIRSNAIINVFVEQRNEKSCIVNKSLLQFVDLAGSDKLDKAPNSEFTQEDVKKVNLSMFTLDNVARSLAAMQNAPKDNISASNGHKGTPYRDSHLTRLLQETIGGNSKTTVLLSCSTAEVDQEETLNTLDFGANVRMVKNFVEQNRSGLNGKAILDLLTKNMAVKEQSYISRLGLLEEEIMQASSLVRQSPSSNKSNELSLIAENSKLKDQINSLSQLLRNSDSLQNIEVSKKEDISGLMGTLMKKCEIVMDLQLKLDEEIAKNHSYSQELSYKSSKEKALEAVNLRLLEQLQSNEEELQAMLVSNSVMKDSMDKWSNIANTRLENIKNLENTVKELSLAKHESQMKRRSSGSSSGSTMVQIEEDPGTVKSSWFFGTTNPALWGSRKAPNIGTIAPIESSSTRAPKSGLNLRAVRPSDEDKMKS